MSLPLPNPVKMDGKNRIVLQPGIWEISIIIYMHVMINVYNYKHKVAGEVIVKVYNKKRTE